MITTATLRERANTSGETIPSFTAPTINTGNTKNKVKKTSKQIPEELLNQLNNPSIENKNIIKLVTSDFVNLPLFGKEGLKARTGLLDFKYDKR